MHQGASLIGIAVALVVVAGPLAFGITGLIRARAEAVPEPVMSWNWRLTIVSALLYALAFNLTFFIQELFLVLPKAFTPGLRPTLFHNNHSWEGQHPLASLFQGTGALATFVSGMTCALLLRRGVSRSSAVRLFLIWMTYNGFLMSLPQVVVGAINPQNDVGMAMDYLHLDATTKIVMALLALAAIPLVSLSLGRPVLSLAEQPTRIANIRARTRFVFQVATLPALIGVLLIIPFRVPRNVVEVVVVPVVVTLIGIAWLQAGAWRVGEVKASGGPSANSIAVPLAALLGLLLVFHLVLKPGIRFF